MEIDFKILRNENKVYKQFTFIEVKFINTVQVYSFHIIFCNIFFQIRKLK